MILCCWHFELDANPVCNTVLVCIGGEGHIKFTIMCLWVLEVKSSLQLCAYEYGLGAVDAWGTVPAGHMQL